jgi:alpha,alpha-trehalase
VSTDTPPLSDYAFLSDTHTSALVGPGGAVEWLCVPQFDSPSVFARILDRHRGGALSVEVLGAPPPGRRYQSETFVLESHWDGPDGVVEVRDALAVADRGEAGSELAAAHVLVRSIRAVTGRARVRVRVEARPDYARGAPTWSDGGDAWQLADPRLWLRSDVALAEHDGVLLGEVELAAGDTAAVLLGWEGASATTDDADRLLEETRRAWATFWEGCAYDGPQHDLVVRSVLVLRALAFDETGALLAAPTTSLPELLGGPRNWDYRFTWHRDASMLVLALHRAGYGELGSRYLRFVLDECVRDTDRLRPMAGLRGEQSGTESELEHLDGYAGSRPVRVGNEAFEQIQYDTYGHVLDAAHVHHQLTGELSADDWPPLRRLVEVIARDWREPDHGLWEMREQKRQYTNSKVLSWVALDRGIELAQQLGDDTAPLDDWRRARDEIHADVCESGWSDEVGAFTMTYGDPALDASLLRIPVVGFLPGDDPRVVATIDRIAERLGTGPALVHRYDTDEVDDGLDGGEGSFLLSSFELVSALVLAGRVEEAQDRFEWLCSRASPLGLYSEEMAGDGAFLGNLPQAFTHLALVEAAVNLAGADEAAGATGNV